MLKLFVTGDNHIGLAYNKFKKPAKEKLVKARIEAFKAMVEKANLEKCDLFVITGDLFESVSPKNEYIKKTFGYLKKFAGEVVVIPGNHDYCEKESTLWARVQDETADSENIQILNEYREYEITAGGKDVLLYPAYCSKPSSEPDENNIGWIRDMNLKPDGKYRIGIAHGTLEGLSLDSDEKYFSMSIKELEEIPVDVWLIGHAHTQFPVNLPKKMQPCNARIFNPGTHCQTHVNNNTEGACFILELGDECGQKSVSAMKYVSGSIHFLREEIKIPAGESLKGTLEHKLPELSDDPENTVLEISVKGAATDKEYAERKSIIDAALDPFLDGRLINDDVSMHITEDFISSRYPETSAAARLMNELLEYPEELQMLFDAICEKKGGN